MPARTSKRLGTRTSRAPWAPRCIPLTLMTTEARRPEVHHRLGRGLSCLVTRVLLGSGLWLAASELLPSIAYGQEPAAAPAVTTATEVSATPTRDAPTNDARADAVHEVTVRGNKTEALKRASGSGTSISEREIKSAQPESTGELL